MRRTVVKVSSILYAASFTLVLLSYLFPTALVFEGAEWRGGLHHGVLGLDTWQSASLPFGIMGGGAWSLRLYAEGLPPLAFIGAVQGLAGHSIWLSSWPLLAVFGLGLVVLIVWSKCEDTANFEQDPPAR